MQIQKRNATPLFIAGFTSLFIFLIIAWGVQLDAGWVQSLDMFWIDHIQASISDGKTSFIKLTTELGNIRLLIVLTILIVLTLFFVKRYVDGLWFGGTILFGAAIVTKLLKGYFDRDRPEFLQLIEKSNESFPSGHATGTTVFYMLLAVTLFLISTKLWQKVASLLITCLFVGYILFTRIYLGVHFPTDVFGGFFLGLAAVLISYGLYFILRQFVHNILDRLKLRDESIPDEELGRYIRHRF